MASHGGDMTGADALLEAHGLITGPRQSAYSHPSDDYGKVVAIFQALTGVALTVDQALLFMVAVKMARLRTNLTEGRLHWDSLTDAVGYLGCLAIHARASGMEGAAAKVQRPSDQYGHHH